MALDLELRSKGFGASELDAVLGFRELFPVWAEKKGGLIRPAATWRMRMGKYLEPVIIAMYADFRACRVEALFEKTFTHPKYPHMLATPDALCLDESRGVDAKLCQFDQVHHWGPTADDTPVRVQLQMQGCMEVLDRDRWDVGLLCGDQYRIIEYERDREFGAYLGEACEKVWARYFDGDERPPVDGSWITREWLKQRYPKHRPADIRPATDEEIELLHAYGLLRAEQKQLQAKRDLLENQLIAAIADREGLSWPHGRFTWRRTKDSTYIDWESMAIGLRQFYVKDEDARLRLTEDYTKSKPGYRRIWFSSDEDYAISEEAGNAA